MSVAMMIGLSIFQWRPKSLEVAMVMRTGGASLSPAEELTCDPAPA